MARSLHNSLGKTIYSKFALNSIFKNVQLPNILVKVLKIEYINEEILKMGSRILFRLDKLTLKKAECVSIHKLSHLQIVTYYPFNYKSKC